MAWREPGFCIFAANFSWCTAGAVVFLCCVCVLRSAKRERWVGGELRRGEVLGEETRPGGGGDHGGVVGGECERGECDLQTSTGCFCGEAGAKLAVGGDSAGDKDAGNAE